MGTGMGREGEDDLTPLAKNSTVPALDNSVSCYNKKMQTTQCGTLWGFIPGGIRPWQDA